MASKCCSSSACPHVSKIVGIQFSLKSPQEIRRGSVAEIVSRDTYVNNKPVIGGLFDPRMGVLEPGLICPTDGLDYMQTPGYAGHIELARPVFYIQYMSTILKILNCVCFNCSKLLVSKELYKQALKLEGENRWKYVHNLAKNVKRCEEDGCGTLQPSKIRKEGLATIIAEWKNEAGAEPIVIKVSPEMVLKIFKRISDEDVTFMGFSPLFSRPDWMICEVMSVPPPAVRPSVKHDAQQRSEDDLTHILVNIIKTNKTLQEKINNGSPAHVIDDWTTVLQYYVATQVDNKIPGVASVAQRSGRPLKSIKDRLSGKGGRMRGNLMAKRVDYSARSVITADPNISIRELGVPLKIAKNITKPVTVNKRNRDFLRKLVANGPDVHPGAKKLSKLNGETIDLKYVDRSSIVLEEGDIVHRHLMDGDPVLFNRQPTLHRMSMMCHIARVMQKGDTFRLNVSATKPYNADFDGDEMNLHMPQDLESEAELRNLAAVPYQIISPGNNSAIMGVFQDSLLGSYLFSRDGIKFNPREAMNLLMMLDTVNEKELNRLITENKTVSNFDLLSQIMPPLSMKYKTKAFNPDKSEKENYNTIIEILNGSFKRGQLDKSVLGGNTRGLLQRICNEFGNFASAKFIDDLQNIVTAYMKSAAFSVGVSDLISNKKTDDEIVEVITRKKNDVKNLIDQTQIGVFENNTGKSNKEEFELKVNNILNQATSESGKIGLKSLPKGNRFVTMVNAGSKGSDLNISFMISCLGQQNVDGKRIPYGLDSRTLPHYTKYDDSPGARGFVENSYVNGLSPQELFMHAQGGREGLIDTAVKTSTTGYMQRRLIKALEDLMVSYDMTIRNNKGKIVQFAYGDDGIDIVKVENQPVALVTMSVQEIYAHFNILEESDRSKSLSKVFLKNAMSRYRNQKSKMMELNQKYTDYIIHMRGEIVKNVFKNKGDSTVNFPVGFHYIINNVQGQMHLSSSSLVDITPVEVYELLETFYDNLEKIHFAPPTALFKVLFFYNMSPKELLIVKRFNRNAIMLLLDAIHVAYKRALVSPGEMVGLLAGQSFGEVSTQLTLNSVTYDTEIAVRDENKIIKKIKIGDFVTWGIENNSKLEYMADKDTTYAEISKFYEIPCATEDGQTVWRRIEAVTKHPVVNEDGSNTLIKVTTKGCREVTATKAKSFLQLVDGKITDVAGADLQVGQYLPVSKKALEFAEVSHLNLRTFLPPSEYIYGSDFARARELSHEHHWWSKYAGKEFVLPYNRSDSCYEALNGSKRRERMDIYAPGCVYTKNNTFCTYTIPEQIPLDYNFGYLVGAYCAEGCLTDHQVKIANNDLAYFEPIYEWCARYNINTKINCQENKGQEGWTSQDLTIYSTLLTHIIDYLAGRLSHNKYVASEIMFSNRECVLGFLDAYFGGDGCVHLDSTSKKPRYISAHSVSYEMLMNIYVMLKNLGVLSGIRKLKMPTHNNRGTTVFQQPYLLEICNQQASKLASLLHMRIADKQERANYLASHSFALEYCRDDLAVPNLLSGNLNATMEPRNNRFIDLEFDEIIDIEEVVGTNYVFDLTVEETRNFDIINGLCQKDTFHFAGVASKSNATRGVPRIEEILSVSSDPRNPSLTVYLKPEDETNKDRAQSVMYMLEHTCLEEIVESIAIYFDPDDLNSLIEEDRGTIEQFRYFENMVKECAAISVNEEDDEANKKSKWIIRMEMDPEIMLEKNITMEDVSFTLRNTFGEDINCIYSDYNADKLVFRVRMNEILKNGMKTSKKKNAAIDQNDQIYVLKNLQDQILQNTVLRGIKGIGKVTMRRIKDNVVENNGVYVKQDIWVLDTMGTNMIDVMGVDYIDPYRTFSNDIVEVYKTLGIEAARQAIYNELVEVIEYDGTYINYHNYSVLIDRMTFTHKIISCFRHGINNDNTGPIAKGSFEETPEMFLKAARHADLDCMRGVSANIMCAQEGFFGTSSFQVVLNLEEMQKLHETSEYKDPVEPLHIEPVPEDEKDNCSIQKLSVQNNVVSIRQTDMGDDNDEYNPGF